MKNLGKDEILSRSKSLIHLYFSYFQLLYAYLYAKSEKYLSVGMMVVLKSSLISKAVFAVVVVCKCW